MTRECSPQVVLPISCIALIPLEEMPIVGPQFTLPGCGGSVSVCDPCSSIITASDVMILDIDETPFMNVNVDCTIINGCPVFEFDYLLGLPLCDGVDECLEVVTSVDFTNQTTTSTFLNFERGCLTSIGDSCGPQGPQDDSPCCGFDGAELTPFPDLICEVINKTGNCDCIPDLHHLTYDNTLGCWVASELTEGCDPESITNLHIHLTLECDLAGFEDWFVNYTNYHETANDPEFTCSPFSMIFTDIPMRAGLCSGTCTLVFTEAA